MEDKEIREAVNKQLQKIHINPYLKDKTLDYITKKSRCSNLKYYKIKRLSLAAMTLATMMLVVLFQYKDRISSVQHLNEAVPINVLNNEQDNVMRTLIQETIFSQFKTRLTDASISFTDDTSFIIEGITIHSLTVNNQQSYFLELSTDLEKDMINQILQLILSEMGQKLSSYQIAKFDDLNYFLYGGQDIALLNTLNLNKIDSIE